MIYINPPAKCEICKKPIVNTFYDANFVCFWANACPDCFALYSIAGETGLGLGLGQRYDKREDGFFHKTGE